MNPRISELFELRSADAARDTWRRSAELAPRPRVRALAWIVFAGAIAAGGAGLRARVASEAGEAAAHAELAAIESSERAIPEDP